MRPNWWRFGFWYFGPSWRHVKWQLVYDLRHWMFGVSYTDAWCFCLGPLRLQQLTTFEEPQQGSWLSEVK